MKIKENNKKGYAEAEEGDGINIASRMEHQRGNVQKGLSQTLKTQIEVGVIDNGTTRERESNCLRIRKLTPLECLKLMGFEESDYLAMREAGLSDAAIYHCAGDSIVVSVLVGIFSKVMNKDHKEIIEQYVERVKNG